MIREILSTLTIGAHLLIFTLLFLAIIGNKRTVALKKWSMHAAMAVAIAAMSGSLYFSEIAGYEPCELCWFQRILMYPLVLITGIALYRKDYSVKWYILPMAAIGAVISGYHYVAGTLWSAAQRSCSLDGPSCFVDYFTDVGYVNIPMMALTGFVLIGIMAYLWKK
jgi:disulfide bond formation protein DsbB